MNAGDGMRVGSIVGVLPAYAGLRVDVTAPAGADAVDVPGGGVVVGWILVAAPTLAGGTRVDPVFLAGGQAWTPDQYRAAYGQHLDVRVQAPG